MNDVLTAAPLPWYFCLAYAVAVIWHFRAEWGSRSSPPVWQWQTESYWWKTHERVVTRSRGRRDALVALILGLWCAGFGFFDTSFWMFAIFGFDLADAVCHGRQWWVMWFRRLSGVSYFVTAAVRLAACGTGATVFIQTAAELGASPIVVLYWLPGLVLSLGGWWQLARKAKREEHWLA